MGEQPRVAAVYRGGSSAVSLIHYTIFPLTAKSGAHVQARAEGLIDRNHNMLYFVAARFCGVRVRFFLMRLVRNTHTHVRARHRHRLLFSRLERDIFKICIAENWEKLIKNRSPHPR